MLIFELKTVCVFPYPTRLPAPRWIDSFTTLVSASCICETLSHRPFLSATSTRKNWTENPYQLRQFWHQCSKFGILYKNYPRLTFWLCATIMCLESGLNVWTSVVSLGILVIPNKRKYVIISIGCLPAISTGSCCLKTKMFLFFGKAVTSSVIYTSNILRHPLYQ